MEDKQFINDKQTHCIICGEPLENCHWSTKILCSEICRKKYRKEYRRAYYQANKERLDARLVLWRKNNPEKRAITNRKYWLNKQKNYEREVSNIPVSY